MRISGLLLASTALLTLGLTVGCTARASSEGDGSEPGTDGPVGRASSAIQGGVADTSVAHNYAVGVAAKNGTVCSGTLIAPNLVLTARHCVVPPAAQDTVTCADAFAPNIAPSQLFVSTQPDLYKTKNYYAASAIVTPTDTAFCGNDIALIVLAMTIPAAEAEPATPVVEFAMTDARLGGTITAMGYGITDPSAKDSGTRRIRQNIPLLCIPGSKNMNCTGTNAKFSDNPGEFVTAGYVCSGDSGSGAFDQRSFDLGTPYVVGALSRGPQTASECLAAVYSRTDVHAQLIKDTAIQAAAQGSYPAPSWTTPSTVPAAEDGPMCNGQTCTETSADVPAELANSVASTSHASGCSVNRSGRSPTSGGLALVGLALAGLFVGRRRVRRAVTG